MIFLPTRAMTASASRSGSSKRSGAPERAGMSFIPAGIGPEALAVALRELPERLPDVGHAARLGVMHGSAAERRKAGGEDHRAVDGVLVRHHALAQARHADVENRQDEPVGHLRRGRGRLAVLHRLAVLPLVEALAGLAAELAGPDLVVELLRQL